MERFWNYIHVSVFKFAISFFNLFSKIDPINLILRIPFIVRAYEKRGIKNPSKQIDNIIFRDKEAGWIVTWAGIQMGGLLVLIEYSLFNFLQAILGRMLIQYIWENIVYKLLFVFGSLVIPGIINYYSLWKNEKYLDYFKKFEKESRSTRIKWFLISIVVIVGILLLLIFSFWLLSVVYQS
ncbi:hypothetical protein [Riemerella anatipestifer]|uniref:hypothetical protein n=1 Tax=Riemerella anatipestifer TaxID=34085 RepID=UPI001374DA20|nr:hypothetical protein [Riemerella anatipestifer]